MQDENDDILGNLWLERSITDIHDQSILDRRMPGEPFTYREVGMDVPTAQMVAAGIEIGRQLERRAMVRRMADGKRRAAERRAANK